MAFAYYKLKILIELKAVNEGKRNAEIRSEIRELCACSKATLSNWERGMNAPDFPEIEKLANYFEMSLNELSDAFKEGCDEKKEGWQGKKENQGCGKNHA